MDNWKININVYYKAVMGFPDSSVDKESALADGVFTTEPPEKPQPHSFKVWQSPVAECLYLDTMDIWGWISGVGAILGIADV